MKSGFFVPQFEFVNEIAFESRTVMGICHTLTSLDSMTQFKVITTHSP